MLRKEAGPKGEELHRAIGIIDGLRACLDHERGGDIAGNLEALYDYMTRRLVEANVADAPEALDEVADLLTEIKSAWSQLTPDAIPSTADEPTAPPPAG